MLRTFSKNNMKDLCSVQYYNSALFDLYILKCCPILFKLNVLVVLLIFSFICLEKRAGWTPALVRWWWISHIIRTRRIQTRGRWLCQTFVRQFHAESWIVRSQDLFQRMTTDTSTYNCVVCSKGSYKCRCTWSSFCQFHYDCSEQL